MQLMTHLKTYFLIIMHLPATLFLSFVINCIKIQKKKSQDQIMRRVDIITFTFYCHHNYRLG